MSTHLPSTALGSFGRCLYNPPLEKSPLRRRRLTTALASGLLSLCFVDVAQAQTDETVPSPKATFDLETLKARNIDPKLAEYFSEATRFREGTHTVTLVLNGTKLGLVDATFDAEGKLCFNRTLLEKGHLRIPAAAGPVPTDPAAAAAFRYDFEGAYPATKVILSPEQDEVTLLVPTDAFQPGGYDVANYASGGTGALLNYDILGQSTRSSGQSSHFLYASTDVGANVGDWILRSRQLYTSNNGKSTFDHLYAYGQRTFTSKQAILQVGQLNIASALFSGGPITGLQILPERALTNKVSGPVVEGIAQSDARVDVSQAGVLIYSTRVPAGPFALSDIPLINGRTDLSVTVVEGNGAERQFVVPIAMLNASGLPSTGYSFAAGKVRDIANIGSGEPLMITGSGSWAYGDRIVGSAGVMGGNGYQALAAGIDSRVSSSTVVSAHATFANAPKGSLNSTTSLRGRAHGTQAVLAFNSALPGSFSIGGSATLQTMGYRDLIDTTYAQSETFYFTRYKSQYTGTLGWSNPTWGGFNLAYSSLEAFDNTKTGRLVASWGKSFRRASVNASFELATGSNQQATANSGNAFYLSANIPLGSSNLRAFVSHRNDQMRSGAQYSDRISDSMNYRVTADHGNGNTDVSANFAFIPRYTQVNVNYGRYGSGNTSALGELSGGFAFHDGSVTASPYPIQDTFGVLTVGDLAGVKVYTPFGPVWTNSSGKAVIPQLTAYRTSRIEVDTKTLPRNVDIKNGFQTVDAGRGSVNDVKFDIVKTRRVLVTVTDDEGHQLEKGAAVLGPDNTFITTVVDGGQIFLPNAEGNESLKVAMPNGKQCDVTVELPKKADTTGYYERAAASCKIQ